jgi:hypothetical protein
MFSRALLLIKEKNIYLINIIFLYLDILLLSAIVVKQN